MKRILENTAAGLFMLMIAAFCAGAQQPATRAALPDSGYVLGPDDQIVIHALDAPEVSDKPYLDRD